MPWRAVRPQHPHRRPVDDRHVAAAAEALGGAGLAQGDLGQLPVVRCAPAASRRRRSPPAPGGRSARRSGRTGRRSPASRTPTLEPTGVDDAGITIWTASMLRTRGIGMKIRCRANSSTTSPLTRGAAPRRALDDDVPDPADLVPGAVQHRQTADAGDEDRGRSRGRHACDYPCRAARALRPLRRARLPDHRAEVGGPAEGDGRDPFKDLCIDVNDAREGAAVPRPAARPRVVEVGPPTAPAGGRRGASTRSG